MEPITFIPLYMERVWGGRELENVYHRTLPDPDLPYGESWEIVDRESEQSVVDQGPLRGKTLHELWQNNRDEIFGKYEDHERFPILIKILDARDDLSIQVHPPIDKAAELGGEPKTEMWYIADCDKYAKLYVGLKYGVTLGEFEDAVEDGSVAELVHSVRPKPGDSIFIPSGRLHAIGAGFLIHEIQQNSDTTYRVFDWNRLGLDGKERELHLEQSAASIDFEDYEPTMDKPDGPTLAKCEFFKTDKFALKKGAAISNPNTDEFSILSVVSGSLKSEAGRVFPKGQFLLLPRGANALTAEENSTVLQITLP